MQVVKGDHRDSELESIRKELLRDDSVLEVIDLGAGSVLAAKNDERSVRDIARLALKNSKNAGFLSAFVEYMNGPQVIELGTSLGLTSMYLQKNSNFPVISIEGSPQIHNKAREIADTIDYPIKPQFLLGNFDDVLPAVLEKIGNRFILYIDGNHSYEATLRYFEWALSQNENLVAIVFDDIYWSQGMTQAWKEIIHRPEIKLSLDLYQFGLVFFSEDFRGQQNFTVRY